MSGALKIYSSSKEIDSHEEWLRSSAPDWFKELQVATRKQKPSMDNPFNDYSSGCPSFIELFKNSYLLCTPHDIMFRFVGEDIECHGTSDFMYFGKHNLGKQMHSYFGDKFVSVKVMLRLKVTTDERMKMVFMHPQYETRDTFPASVINGVVPFVPGAYVELNTNMIVKRSDISEEEVFVPKGTPLAYLYFPEGKPSIEAIRCSEEDFYKKHFNPKSYFAFNYIKKYLSKW